MTAELRELAERVIRQEASAVESLLQILNDEFFDVVSLLAKCRGKVVVTGIGKSGHVGRKMAASLASLGTPAFFVHATEALHGDLGMIGQDDVVIAISNSGETAEVIGLLPNLEMRRIPVIAITSNGTSTLASRSYRALTVAVAEADPLGVAPTSSTTSVLALGDTLALLLSHLKGFSRADFGFYHPGGALGSVLRKTDWERSGTDGQYSS